jgi:NADP-dependent aldehyde dehydrogenase
MQLEGKSLIAASSSNTSGQTFHAVNPTTSEKLEPAFFSAGADDVNQAAQAAHEAFATYKNVSGRDKGHFLRAIANGLNEAKESIIERAAQETALPKPRLEGELGRTVGQFLAFAELIEEGSWVEARIDRGNPERLPLPKPDLRSMLRPVGPVAVFGASNFPLAYSVGGGDTASALAAGCPVIVKAHPAHPGTSEIVGRVLQKAVQECGLPAGVFSLLFDAGHEVGLALVKHPLIKAVGFTGSRRGGRALMDAAAARPEPIPVYAEMGSINPVVILPGALHEKSAEIASGLQNSVTLGVGQFCTNPGLVFLPQSDEGNQFMDALTQSLKEAAPGVMLTEGISKAYQSGLQKLEEAGAKNQVRVNASEGQAGAALSETSAAQLSEKPELMEEVFGPATLVVRYETSDELREALQSVEGQLTATLHATSEELATNADLVALLEDKAGRLLFGGFPTGVEVAPSMVHGGPYPATGDGRSTSVGTRAIFRFVRPVCWQNFPDSALPDELKNENPLGIMRLTDGELARK